MQKFELVGNLLDECSNLHSISAPGLVFWAGNHIPLEFYYEIRRQILSVQIVDQTWKLTAWHIAFWKPRMNTSITIAEKSHCRGDGIYMDYIFRMMF
jgi:hypothetical protein